MDTFFATKKGGQSSRGHTCCQLFVTDKGFIYVVPMKKKSEVLLAIKQFTKEIGAPDSFVADMSGEQMSSEVKKFCNDIGTTLRALEEGTPWSNKAELYIGLIKEAVRKDMRESNSPLCLWDYCVERRARINNLTAKNAFKLHGSTPHTVTTGDEGDISNLCQYGWYEWCYFTQCNHSQYPILMKKNCTHNLSTSQVSKSSHPNPVTFPYPPDPGEHVLETSSAPTTLVERDKLDLSSLIPPKGEMESSFSWTCPFKSPTSSTLCFGEPTLGKLNHETDSYMTKHITKNGEHFYGENFIHDFPKSWKHIKEVDWGDQLKLNYTTYGYMLMEIDWGGKFNYTSCGYPMANWQGHETHPTGHKTSEVDWGGHDPNGSDNPPPMSIINLDDLLGRTFLLPMDENGERKRATISEHVKDQLRFKLKIDGDRLDDLIAYNQLMEYLENKTETGPLEDGFYRFKCIKDHKGPYTSSDPEYNGSSYNLLIEWEPGEQK